MIMADPPNFLELNDKLLSAAQEKNEEVPNTPKRNSKEDLIQKIINVAREGEVDLKHSNTKLKRMNKQQLQKLFAEVTSDAVRNQMAAQVGAKPGAQESVIALGALRMIHDCLAYGTEKGLNMLLPRWGFEVNGFVDTLKDPSVRECTDACIAEIARDSNLLAYIESPYSRLAIAWSGALLRSVRKYDPPIKDAPNLEPKPRGR